MLKNILLILAIRIFSIFAVFLIVSVFIYKIYGKIRPRFNKIVNCWFCDMNTSVPYLERNSWYCPHCDQYNGFKSDGDYNCDVTHLRDDTCYKNGLFSTSYYVTKTSPQSIYTNGFCETCNEAQHVKVKKLADFEPTRESRFEDELKNYKKYLEEKYQLCANCERHLRNVLQEKKKMVLGSKFLDFIMKRAELLKEPYFKRNHKNHQLKRKQHILFTIIFITLCNIWYLLYKMPALSHRDFKDLVGNFLGEYLFFGYTHIVALVHELHMHVALINKLEIVEKFILYFRTILTMVTFTFRWTTPRLKSISVDTIFIRTYPLVMLVANLFYSVLDGLKFSRFTILFLWWSIYHVGFLGENEVKLMFLASVVTLMLAITYRIDDLSKLNNSSNNFHKLGCDTDKISLLSRQVHGSNYSQADSVYQQNILSPGRTKNKNGSGLTQRYSAAQTSIATKPSDENFYAYRKYHNNENSEKQYTFVKDVYQPNLLFSNGQHILTTKSIWCKNQHTNASRLTVPYINLDNATSFLSNCHINRREQSPSDTITSHSKYDEYGNVVLGSMSSATNILLPSRFRTNSMYRSPTCACVTRNVANFDHNKNTHYLSRSSSQLLMFGAKCNTAGNDQKVYYYDEPQLDCPHNLLQANNYNKSSQPSHLASSLRNISDLSQNYVKRDSFNWHKINEELPSIERRNIGRWNEQQLNQTVL